MKFCLIDICTMDDIESACNEKYFSLTKLEGQIDLKEDPETFDEARQRQEFLKCANDFAYFCHRYVKIEDWSKNELVPFLLYNHQRRSIAHSLGNRFSAIIKPRRMGLSLAYQAFALWRGLFRYGERIMILSQNLMAASRQSKSLRIMIRNLPSWLKPAMSKMNTYEAHFLDSDTHVCNYIWEASRGRSLDWLILDEVSVHRNMERSWAALLPTIANVGRCIAFSSMAPNASSWTWWNEAISGNLDFNILELSYREHPNYNDDEWACQMESIIGTEAFRTEILCQNPESNLYRNSDELYSLRLLKTLYDS